MSTRLKEKYTKEIIPEIKKELGYKNNMAVSRVVKVVVNMGLGKFLREGNKDDLKRITKDFADITGQKPVVTKAKKAIAGFKIRKGMPVGLMATIRGVRMYEFLDRLVSITLPQIRDFQGLSKKAFDKNGNFNIGIKEHIIFPEVSKEDIKYILGIEVSVVTTAKTDEEAYKLLKGLGFPITS